MSRRPDMEARGPPPKRSQCFPSLGLVSRPVRIVPVINAPAITPSLVSSNEIGRPHQALGEGDLEKARSPANSVRSFSAPEQGLAFS